MKPEDLEGKTIKKAWESEDLHQSLILQFEDDSKVAITARTNYSDEETYKNE